MMLAGGCPGACSLGLSPVRVAAEWGAAVLS
jgi:hypothetical protein